MTIQWFPGHMTRAKRQMQEAIKTVDMVIEIRDSRIPNASKNPMIDQLIQNKPRLILLSKKDKGDLQAIDEWIKYLTNETTLVLAIDFLHDNVIEIIVKACKQIMKAKIDKQISRGIRPRAIRAMVVGIPNVGKSTLINRIAKKKVTETANKPGVTRALQWIKLNKDLELLDTPGVLWPKFEDQEVGYYLALTGAIRDEVLNLEEIAAFAMKKMIAEYPNNIKDLYGIEVQDNPYEMIEEIGRVKKLIRTNNEVDYKRAVEYFIHDLRDDNCGRITWEKVHDQTNK
ncbi:ribosome biogenesis GTPase YlqF [Anaerorhabdus sp.]|uniref:ribosome biogenesis GTPase YlqF n=1 Tax=Anaerorhabdus sp. TaxID=1872524 RepID=UPI002B1ED3F8|nr:ribosome biogenesis GTPase YlqF [Anaerorhabdus sp.]MEA4875115.1 ribosome biogenesis GTPase YlqF [Anaerorhabdus sp.]